MSKTFIVDCNRWANSALNNGVPKLLNNRGNMCCLGFCLRQCGINESSLFGKNYPSSGPRRYSNNLRPFVRSDSQDTKLSNDAAAINDDSTLSLFQKIKALKTLFKSKGYAIKFINVPEVDVNHAESGNI